MQTAMEILERANIKAGRNTRLDALGLDSLELLELYVELDVPRDKIGSLETVGDLCDCADARAAV